MLPIHPHKIMINISQAGATLLEMVIAFFVLSLGILGVIQIQALSVRHSHEAHLHTLAIFQAQNLLEQFRLYQVSPHDSGANALIAAWNEINQQVLPMGEGKVSIENNQIIIDIFWQEVAFHASLPCYWFADEKRMCLRWVGTDENE